MAAHPRDVFNALRSHPVDDDHQALFNAVLDARPGRRANARSWSEGTSTEAFRGASLTTALQSLSADAHAGALAASRANRPVRSSLGPARPPRTPTRTSVSVFSRLR